MCPYIYRFFMLPHALMEKSQRYALLAGLTIMPPLNQAAKQTLGYLLNLAFSSGGRLEEPSQAIPDAAAGATISEINERYLQWAISTEGEGFKLLLMTCRGLFWLHLPSLLILQATPPKKPRIASDIMPEYSRLYTTVFTQKTSATQDHENILRRFQLNCLLNMIVRDLRLILSKKRARGPDIVPYLKTLLNEMSAIEPLANGDTRAFHDLETKLFPLPLADTKRTEVIDFYNQYKTIPGLHVTVASPQEEDCMIGLGMLFQRVFGDLFCVILERPTLESSDLLPESILSRGNWTYGFRVRYRLKSHLTS